MTQNLASKYSSVVDEKFKLGSMVAGLTNQDYEWDGVNSIYVYNISTAPLNNYVTSGSSRYGTPAELNDTVTNYAVAQDKAFTFTIDKKFEQDQVGVKAAGAALARQIDQVVIPYMDKFILGTMEAAADINYSYGVNITKTNAYENILVGLKALGNSKVPFNRCVVICGYSFFGKIRLDSAFLSANEIAQEMKLNGQAGTIEGMPVIVVPDSYLANTTNFLIVNRDSVVAPVKLTDYITHVNPIGVNGTVIEGRIRHDAHALKNKIAGIYLNTSGAKPSGATGTGAV